MVKMKLQNVLPSTSNPSSAVEAIFGGFGVKSPDKQNTGDANRNKAKPEDVLTY